MTGKLTESKITKAKIPAGKRQLILRDGGGLSVRILPGGSKTYWFRYRTAGGRESSVGHMVKIGSADAISLADARKAARVLAGRVARGEDPAAERQEAKREAERREREAELRAGSTLGTLLAEDGEYDRHLARHHRVNRKAIMSGLRRGLDKLTGKSVLDLTRLDLVTAITAIEKAGKPGAAADLRKFSRTFLEWCANDGRIPANPIAGYRRPARSRAEQIAAQRNGGRALGDDEIRKVWQAAGERRLGSFGALVRLALLSAGRRGELARLERARDIHDDRLVVQAENAKTGQQHAVPLTPLMRSIIAGQPVTTSPLIFPSSVTGGRIHGWTKFVAKLQQASGVDFTLHDLRRTCRTLMSRLGVKEDVAELAIGHVRADLIRRYNFDDEWPARVDAFTRVSAHIEHLIGAREGAAVIPLRG